MKRKLLAQMCHEWRSNIWMTVELLVVGVVLCVVFSILLSIFALHKAPEGADFDNLYTGWIGYIEEDNDAYRPYDENHSYSTDLEIITAKLKSNPNVEIVGYGDNMLPYNYSYWGTTLTARIDTALQQYNGNLRTYDPEAIKAIRLTGLNGESTDELAAMIERGDYMISTQEVWRGDKPDIERWRGMDAAKSYDSTKIVHIGAIINGIRRMDYERCQGVIMRPLSGRPGQVVVRVRPGSTRDFLDSLDGDDLEHGNVYISGLKNLADIRTEAHRDVTVMLRNVSVCALFVMISIFLGFLGTFWFRTAQRVPELALRKVNGATNANIFRRCFSEGLLLLVIPTIALAAAVFFGSGYLMESGLASDISGFEFNKPMFWLAAAISVGAMAMMIVAGVAIPARRAMKIEPARALSEE